MMATARRGGRVLMGRGGMPLARPMNRLPMARPHQIDKPQTIEDLFSDEDNDWIVEDDDADEKAAWRKSMPEKFNPSRFNRGDDGDLVVSTASQIRREELQTAKIAAAEDLRERERERQLALATNNESDYEGSSEDSEVVGDFIVSG